MKAKSHFMKKMLACFGFVACFISSHAQNISVDVRYRIDPEDSTIPTQTFFNARLGEAFGSTDKKALLDLTARRILMKVNAGDSVVNYNSAYDLFPGFAASTTIADCKNIPLADFAKPSGQIGDQAWINDVYHDRFKLKEGKAVSSGLTVVKDKGIAFAADTLMTTDTEGMQVPLLRYRYLQPEQVSIFFTERWSFDPARGHMEKSVRYYGYYLKKYTYAGDYVGHTPVLCIQNPESVSPMKKQILVKKNVICDVAVNWSEQMLRNDTNMQRYGGADAVNYLSIAEGNIPEGDRSKMLAAIFSFAWNHPENVYPSNGGAAGTSAPFKSAEEMQPYFTRKDSISVQYSDDPDTWEKGVLETKLSLGDVYAVRFYEDWYYDEKDLTMKKVVNGIGFIMLKWNNVGLPLLEDAGIYIRMN